MLDALMVQTPRELTAFRQGVASFRVCDRNGHRSAAWSAMALAAVETAGNTRWPNHSEMCGREAGSRLCPERGGWGGLKGGLVPF